jgi:cytochrome c-type biogenesis protein
MMVLYAMGHCLPIVAAGSSSAFIRRLIENNSWQMAGLWFRRMAGAVIALLGMYFIANPIFATV